MATAATEPRSGSAPARSWAPRRFGDAQVELALAAAMIAAILLLAWFGRDTTFTPDEFFLFSASPHLDLHAALEPYNGHLILIPRLIYAAILNSSGADYAEFRFFGIAAVILTSTLFFVFARRRVGALAALAPTLVLLFFGSDYPHLLSGSGFAIFLTQAAGIGALLALEREDGRGDVLACALLSLSLATYTEGLPFVVAAAVLILLGADRRRRVWVFLIPVALYAAWLLWSHNRAGGAESSVDLSNLLLAPNWAFNSLASSVQSLVGLNYPLLGSGWGPVVAVMAFLAVGLRLWQGSISRSLWAMLALLGTLWLMGAVAAHPPARVPGSARYIYPGAIAVLLVACEAARGVPIQRRAMTILYALAAIGLATNIALLRDGSQTLRRDTRVTRAELAAVELDRGRIGTHFPTAFGLRQVLRTTGDGQTATGYLEAVRQYGSPALSLPELRAQGELVRDDVDAALGDANGLVLRPTEAPAGPCRTTRGTAAGQGVSFELPRGGAVLRSNGIAAPLAVRRFGNAFAIQAGQLSPGQWMALSLPHDSAPDRWYAATSATPLQICGPPH